MVPTFKRCGYRSRETARKQGMVRLDAVTVLEGWSAEAYAGPLGVTILMQELLDADRLGECLCDTLFASWADLGFEVYAPERTIKQDAMAYVDWAKNGNRDTLLAEWPTTTLDA